VENKIHKCIVYFFSGGRTYASGFKARIIFFLLGRTYASFQGKEEEEEEEEAGCSRDNFN
jgi:hypothetical protein